MQNETLKVIRNRRSIRAYKAEQISDEEVQAILEAALYAPSANNSQGWHFSVIQNAAELEKLRACMKTNMRKSGIEGVRLRANDPTYVPFFNAPTLILITAEIGARSAQIDSGIAAENIALAAESLNIGSCIMTSSAFLFSGSNCEELKTELGVPETYEHICTVALGYKDGEQPIAQARKSGTVNYVK
ncbi:MAG: nitroreductase family protein [Anaerolineaceae bacterium]